MPTPKNDIVRPPATEGTISIIEGLSRISSENFSVTLDERERGQFERARLAEEEAQRARFVLGGQVAYRR
jgi:hypothetical protein